MPAVEPNFTAVSPARFVPVTVTDVVAAVPTADGKGYWMVGSDGGVFAFGDAGFVGSLPGLGVQAHDIVGAVPTATGRGYWMVGADGGVFAFGDATWFGAAHERPDAAAMVLSHGTGYWGGVRTGSSV